jgi:hypothetical protein
LNWQRRSQGSVLPNLRLVIHREQDGFQPARSADATSDNSSMLKPPFRAGFLLRYPNRPGHTRQDADV